MLIAHDAETLAHHAETLTLDLCLVTWCCIARYHIITQKEKEIITTLYVTFDPSKLGPVTINMSSTVLNNEIIIPTAGKHGEQGMFI